MDEKEKELREHTIAQDKTKIEKAQRVIEIIQKQQEFVRVKREHEDFVRPFNREQEDADLSLELERQKFAINMMTQEIEKLSNDKTPIGVG